MAAALRHDSDRRRGRFRPSLALILLWSFLALLIFSGGASRADVLGQAVVRASAWTVVTVLILRPALRNVADVRPVALLLIATIAIPLLQLIPLPPSLWLSLPGHAEFAVGNQLTGNVGTWRPLSLAPEATINALSSLIVPLAMVTLIANIVPAERRLLPTTLLAAVASTAVVGLMQASGIGFEHPLINADASEISGLFANRNHFALFLAIGCLVTPVWATSVARPQYMRMFVAVGSALLFILVILATGSRAGILLGPLGLLIGIVIAWPALRNQTIDSKARAAAGMAVIVFVGAFAIIIASIVLGRAESIKRIYDGPLTQDLRFSALPVLIKEIARYFPTGSGLGAFDPVYRIHEPFEQLSLVYLNHAHNDFLEIALDAGGAGALLVFCALIWWGKKSFSVWFGNARHSISRMGSSVILLIMIASLFDYPARTPLIMATLVLAACWLNRNQQIEAGAPLPTRDLRL